MSEQELLDEKGFEFTDEQGRNYWCRLWSGKPWLFIKLNSNWMSLREVSQTDVWMFDNQYKRNNKELKQ